MFTGIIEEVGEVKQIRKISGGLELQISASQLIPKLKDGDSVAIDGACQTVVHVEETQFTVQAVGETLLKTTFREYQPGRRVNLESALTLNTPLGGHMVQGHVQGLADITGWRRRGDNYYLELELPENLMRYCIAEGSIAVDGISLTIAQLKQIAIGISIVPYTVEKTTLRDKQVGDQVNIETDLVARYVEKFTASGSAGNITFDKLKNWGY
jgi:riboflavin synthase